MREVLAVVLLLAAAPALAQADRCAAISPAAQGYESVTVFFAIGSSALDDRARAAIRRAAGQIVAQHKDHVCLIGRASPTGSPQANERLAAARVRAVTDALVAGGVARPLIGAQVQGAAWGARVDRAENEADRSVTILYPR
ncbi:OmpA family protein [Elioraea thermophila]|uniref:OmpA family protein n=1 Tax=Elioraea thermophila TaxID=2185104 RepID=UPI000DF48E8B|nr:OmpA family protein [Elioraea thermophila]